MLEELKVTRRWILWWFWTWKLISLRSYGNCKLKYRWEWGVIELFKRWFSTRNW